MTCPSFGPILADVDEASVPDGPAAPVAGVADEDPRDDCVPTGVDVVEAGPPETFCPLDPLTGELMSDDLSLDLCEYK